MLHCGLLGRKLGHSYSPAIHAAFGDYEYRLYEKEPEKKLSAREKKKRIRAAMANGMTDEKGKA